jgi:hypothetical protein
MQIRPALWLLESELAGGGGHLGLALRHRRAIVASLRDTQQNQLRLLDGSWRHGNQPFLRVRAVLATLIGMASLEWHVRPSANDVRVWETRCGDSVVARGTMDQAWERARAEARASQGQAHLYYRLRGGIKDTVDFRKSTHRAKPVRCE